MADPILAFINRVKRQQVLLERQQLRIEAEVKQGGASGPGLLWGEKECATTAMAKLAQVHIKWAELELDALRLRQPDASTGAGQGEAPLLPEDLAIMERSLHRLNRMNPEQFHEDARAI